MADPIQKPKKMTVDEFLDWVETQPIPHDLIDGIPHPRWATPEEMMSGGSTEHDLIAGNIYHAFRSKLDGKPCRPWGPNVAVVTKVGLKDKAAFPDVSVDCGFDDRPVGGKKAIKPVVVVEVLSPSTRGYDIGIKREIYEQHPTIEYILHVEQNVMLARLHNRQSEDFWTVRFFSNPSADIEFASLNMSLSMSEIYEDVKFLTEE